jgi:hypothetical protein
MPNFLSKDFFVVFIVLPGSVSRLCVGNGLHRYHPDVMSHINLKSSVFCDTTLYSQVKVNKRFGRAHRFNLQGWRVAIHKAVCFFQTSNSVTIQDALLLLLLLLIVVVVVVVVHYYYYKTKLTKTNSVASVRERTIPTERPPLVGEVNSNFCGWRVPHGQRDGSLRPHSRISRPDFYLWVLHSVAPLSNWFLMMTSIATKFQYINSF